MKGIIFNPKRTAARESGGVGSAGGAAEWGAAAVPSAALSCHSLSPAIYFFPRLTRELRNRTLVE